MATGGGDVDSSRASFQLLTSNRAALNVWKFLEPLPSCAGEPGARTSPLTAAATQCIHLAAPVELRPVDAYMHFACIRDTSGSKQAQYQKHYGNESNFLHSVNLRFGTSHSFGVLKAWFASAKAKRKQKNKGAMSVKVLRVESLRGSEGVAMQGDMMEAAAASLSCHDPVIQPPPADAPVVDQAAAQLRDASGGNLGKRSHELTSAAVVAQKVARSEQEDPSPARLGAALVHGPKLTGAATANGSWRERGSGPFSAVQTEEPPSPGPSNAAARALLALAEEPAGQGKTTADRVWSTSGTLGAAGQPVKQIEAEKPVDKDSEVESGGSCAPAPLRPPVGHPPEQHEVPQILLLPNRTGIRFGEKLGSGSFGAVYEASLEGKHWPSWLLEKSVVVKVLHSSATGGRIDRRSYDEFILGSVRHPSLVGCLGFTQSLPLCALFERCNRGSMWEVLQGSKRSEDKVRLLEAIRSKGIYLVVQLGEGIAHLHSLGLIHCDLHEKNVLLHGCDKNLQLRIADFGLCSRTSDRRSHKMIRVQERADYRRRHPFVAPELLVGGDYSPASDMWAVGFLAEKVLGIERWTGKPLSGVCKVRLSARSSQVLSACSSVASKDRPSINAFLDTFRKELRQ